MVFGDEKEDVVDVDFNLFDEFELENDVVVDVFFVGVFVDAEVLVDVDVGALVVLEVTRGEDFVAGEIVEGGEDVLQAKDGAVEADEVFCGGFAQGWLAEGEGVLKSGDELGVAGLVMAVFFEAVVIVIVGAEEDDATGLFVTEKGNGVVGCFFEVTEADNVAEGFDGVEDAVGARKGLDQAVLAEVFVDPEGVEGRGVKSGKEHVDDEEDIDFAVFDAQGDIFVVVLEFV